MHPSGILFRTRAESEPQDPLTVSLPISDMQTKFLQTVVQATAQFRTEDGISAPHAAEVFMMLAAMAVVPMGDGSRRQGWRLAWKAMTRFISYYREMLRAYRYFKKMSKGAQQAEVNKVLVERAMAADPRRKNLH